MSFFHPWKNRSIGSRLLLLGGVATTMVVLFLALLRLPVVQLWVLQWAVGGDKAWRLEAARVSIGPAEGEVTGVRFGMPGLTAHSESGVVVRIDPFGWIRGRRELRVLEARVEGVHLAVTPSQLEDSATPFDGVLASLQSPLPWSVAQARVEIAADVTEKEGGLGRGSLLLEGGGLSRDESGRFNYTLTVDSPLVPGWAAAGFRSVGVADIRQRPDHGVGRIEVRGSLVLPPIRGVALPAGTVQASAEATAAGEHYSGRWEMEPKTWVGWEADFDRAASRVSGRITGAGAVHLLAGFFAGTALPEGTVAATVDFSLDSVTGAATAVVEASVELSELGRLGSEWAGLGAWSGRLRGRVERASATDAWRVMTSRMSLGTEAQPDIVVVEGQGVETATVRVQDFPLERLAPWLHGLGLATQDGRVNGAWQVARAEAGQVTVTPLKPGVVGPLRIEGATPATLPSVNLEFDLAATADVEGASWQIRPLNVRPADAASVGAVELSTRGRWKFSGGGVIEEARLTWRSTADTADAAGRLQVRLLGPLELDPDGFPFWRPGQAIAELQVAAWPLEEMGKWMRDFTWGGTWMAGASILTGGNSSGELTLHTPAPWQFAGLTPDRGGATPAWMGLLQVAPEGGRTPTAWLGRLVGLEISDTAGRKLAGKASGTWRPSPESYDVQLDLTATGPRGTLMPSAWGEMTVDLSLKGGTAANSVQQVERISLVARDATVERLRLTGDMPLLGAQRSSGEWLFSTVAPWKVSVASMPLSDLAEFLPKGWVVDGRMDASEFLLSAAPNTWQLRPLRPVSFAGLSLTQEGVEVVRDLAVSFFPGVDVNWHHTLRPQFQLAWEASIQATEVRVQSAGGELLQLEGALGLIGDDRDALMQRVDLVARGNLAEARKVLPTWGPLLPSAGKFTARIDGGLSIAKSLQGWLRIEDVPDSAGERMLAPLEVSAEGKVDGAKRSAEMSVDLRLGVGEMAGDLSFGVRFGLEDQTLRITSALRGKRWDMNETLAYSRAWRLAETSSTAPVATGPTAVPSRGPGSSAFWGPLRGTFDLDLKQVLWSPYRMDDVRARIDLDEHRLTLSGLGGTMFSGKLDGSLGVVYAPGAPDGDHRLTGDVQIRQFETARVVQTMFPQELGSLDARVDLRSSVRGRGFQLWDLLEHAEVDFGVEGRGTVRLTDPDVRTASTLLVMGGLITLSPELRALGRLLRKFAEMPVDHLTIEGGRDATGAIRLSNVWFDSPQARLQGTGEVPAATSPLVARPLDLRFDLSARDEVGLILGRMRLLEPGVDPQGFRRMNRRINVGGHVGRPDASGLYELLAKAVQGSRGTWGLIMRKVQREAERQQALSTNAKAKESAR